ncbi:MAG: Lrp/AsnC family transcriptional regulator, partial [bacterium]|nr:Lrp/AsnC family transcriptional regulator [bacterium]
MTIDMDDLDRAILNRIQSNFPLVPHPYQSIAEDLGLSEKELLMRLVQLKENGVIR